jgi:hypothetical protein
MCRWRPFFLLMDLLLLEELLGHLSKSLKGLLRSTHSAPSLF